MVLGDANIFYGSGSSGTFSASTSITYSGTPPDCVTCEVDETVEYIDGEIYGTCTNCDKRIHLIRIPGATSVSRIKEIMALAVAGEADATHLGELMVLRTALVEDRDAIDHAEELLDLATGLIDADHP